jgi:phage terminase large subunit-like protein
MAFSSEDPEALRGPQFDAAWGDEFCYWTHVEATLEALWHGLRLGADPRLLLTTTPRPISVLKRLLARSDAAVTSAKTWDNVGGLSPAFLQSLRDDWRGSARERQELLGALIEDEQGALWKRGDIEAGRTRDLPAFDRVIVAVDPPASVGANADACGIIGAGAYGEGRARRAVVLADSSMQGAAPREWAERAALLAETLGADAIVAEGNNGGELVRTLLRLAAPEIPVRLVHAQFGKRMRAGPVAALYEQGRVAHAASFPALEDEMCSFGAPGFYGSPDRLDALVWALTDLLLDNSAPRLRAL